MSIPSLPLDVNLEIGYGCSCFCLLEASQLEVGLEIRFSSLLRK